MAYGSWDTYLLLAEHYTIEKQTPKGLFCVTAVYKLFVMDSESSWAPATAG